MSSNPITIACAPCCWGVDDVSNPHLPPWERGLDEAADAGFGGLELGPYGYMPLNFKRVGGALEMRGLGGRLEDMGSFDKYIGGSPTNMACGTARLGLKSALITRVGDEHMGRFIREQLAREGVESFGAGF